jgi:hypothetical protein
MRTLLASAAVLLLFGIVVALAFIADLFRSDSLHPLGPIDEL